MDKAKKETNKENNSNQVCFKIYKDYIFLELKYFFSRIIYKFIFKINLIT
jgi:hypothetical protein